MNSNEDTGFDVIVGAGPVGTETAQAAAARPDARWWSPPGPAAGRSWTVSGASPWTRVDRDALTEVADGAGALFNCANPGDYTLWEPGLAAAGREPSGRGRTDRRHAGHGCRPLPVRSGRRADGRGHARIWRPTTRAGCGPGCGPRPRPGTTPAGSAPSRSAPRTTSAPGSGDNGHITRQLPDRRTRPSRLGDRRSRPAAHLDRRRRHGPGPGRRCGPSGHLGSGLARSEPARRAPSARR